MSVPLADVVGLDTVPAPVKAVPRGWTSTSMPTVPVDDVAVPRQVTWVSGVKPPTGMLAPPVVRIWLRPERLRAPRFCVPPVTVVPLGLQTSPQNMPWAVIVAADGVNDAV